MLSAVAYDETRSKSLIADHMTSDPDDQERLPVLLSTVVQSQGVRFALTILTTSNDSAASCVNVRPVIDEHPRDFEVS